MRFFLPLVIFLILVGFLWKGLDFNPRDIPSALLSKRTPEFKLPNLKNSNEIVTEEVLKGQITVLNCWASWCLSCQEEHEFWLTLAKNSALFKDTKLRLVSLNIHDDEKSALEWLKERGDPYHTNIFDKEGKLGMDFGIYGTPETFILDSKGVVLFRHTGPVDKNIWQAKILPIIQLQLNKELDKKNGKI